MADQAGVGSMSNFSLLFNPDARGRGDLELWSGGTHLCSVPCRTGSINTLGELVNALPSPEVYYVKEPSVGTSEIAMIWPGQQDGWKTRLWIQQVVGEYMFTHLLIHPDGSAHGTPGDGTMGCIGIEGDGLYMRRMIDTVVDLQQIIPLYAGMQMPEEVIQAV